MKGFLILARDRLKDGETWPAGDQHVASCCFTGFCDGK